jgi:hypothetical protein
VERQRTAVRWSEDFLAFPSKTLKIAHCDDAGGAGSMVPAPVRTGLPRIRHRLQKLKEIAT